jgi:hypothetical protein
VISDDSRWHTFHPWTRTTWTVINFQCLISIFTHSAENERLRGVECKGHKT